MNPVDVYTLGNKKGRVCFINFSYVLPLMQTRDKWHLIGNLIQALIMNIYKNLSITVFTF